MISSVNTGRNLISIVRKLGNINNNLLSIWPILLGFMVMYLSMLFKGVLLLLEGLLRVVGMLGLIWRRFGSVGVRLVIKKFLNCLLLIITITIIVSLETVVSAPPEEIKVWEHKSPCRLSVRRKSKPKLSPK